MAIAFMDPCSIDSYKAQTWSFGSGTVSTSSGPGYRDVNGYYAKAAGATTSNRSLRLPNVGLSDPTTGQWRSFGYAYRLEEEVSTWLPGFCEQEDWSEYSSTTVDFGIVRNSDGTISVRYSSTASVNTGFILPLNTWVWVSAACQWSSTAQWAVSVNGVTIADHTMHGTANPTGELWYYFHALVGYGGRSSVDDIVIGDDSTPYSPLKVRELVPSTTNVADWTGSDADKVDNHLLVNNPSDDATYVAASTTGLNDLYSTQGGLVTAPLSIQPLHRCMYTGATGPGMSTVVNSVGADVTANIIPSGAFAWYRGSAMANSPGTAAPWTADNANQARIGVRSY